MVNGVPAAATVSENDWGAVCAVGVAESVTVMVKVDVAAVVGVPVITPAVLMDSPAGRVPEVTAQVYGAVPPLAARVSL